MGVFKSIIRHYFKEHRVEPCALPNTIDRIIDHTHVHYLMHMEDFGAFVKASLEEKKAELDAGHNW